MLNVWYRFTYIWVVLGVNLYHTLSIWDKLPTKISKERGQLGALGELLLSGHTPSRYKYTFFLGGGGFKYFFEFSPRTLGKMNPIWRAYFSKGWFNHQLVYVILTPKPPIFTRTNQNGLRNVGAGMYSLSPLSTATLFREMPRSLGKKRFGT